MIGLLDKNRSKTKHLPPAFNEWLQKICFSDRLPRGKKFQGIRFSAHPGISDPESTHAAQKLACAKGGSFKIRPEVVSTFKF